MEIDHEFTVSVPVARAWEVLTDIEGIAPCLPGAQLTGEQDGVYQGRVTIKVGPVTTQYEGTAAFAHKDDEAHRAVIDAKGRDPRGAGNAAATITAQLRPDGERTLVTVTTDLKITGRVAQFGRGMIKDVSEKLLSQFVASLESKIAAAPEPAAAAAAAGQAPAAGAEETSAPAASVDADGGPGATGSAPAAPAASTAASAPASDPAPAALNVMGLAGGAIAKRLAPVAIAALVVVGIIVYFAVR